MKITSFLFKDNINEIFPILITENMVTKKYNFTIHTVRQTNEFQTLKESEIFTDHLRVHESEGGF